MNEPWEEVTLDQVANDVTVGHVGPMADQYVDSGIPFLRSLNVEPFRINTIDLKQISREFHRRLKKSALKPGDVVIVRTGKPGACAVIPDWLPEANCSDVVVVRANLRVRPSFISYIVNSSAAHHIDAHTVGAVQQHFNVGSARQIRFRLPPIAEQDRILGVLGALNDKIELNERMNETLEATARAIFKDWFVNFGPTCAKMEGRSPYLAPNIWSLFPDTLDEDGKKPAGWSTEAVYEQAIWVNGAAYKNMHFSSEPDALPVVKIVELKAGITRTTRFTNTDLGERYKIHDGELLFSWSGNPDTSIDTFVWTSGTAWLNQHIFAVRPNGKRSQAFLYAMLKFLRSEFAEIARNKQTTGLGHVTQQDLIRLKITAPSEGAQSAFDDVVGPLHARFTSNLFENQSLIATRDFLLPKLMSGEVRVKDAEKLVEEAT